jgi:dienelactone hydrolase
MVRLRFLMIMAVFLLAAASPARKHYYWFPAASDAKPRPWAVLLPRAEGLGKLAEGNQYRDLARWLNRRGIDALVIDYARAGSQVPSARGKTGPKIAAIVTDALADAREQRRMDMRCSGVAIGWSRGGEGVLTLASAEEGGRTGVKAAIVYYPSVRGQERPWRQLHPVMALQGEADGIAPAASLKALVEGRAPTRMEFAVHLYTGARHRFDVAHPVDDPGGKTPGDFDAQAHADALAAIGAFLDRYSITTGGCALD